MNTIVGLKSLRDNVSQVDLEKYDKHINALSEHYKSNSIDDNNLQQMLEFWEVSEYGWSHDPSDELKLGILEHDWLITQFPQDFELY